MKKNYICPRICVNHFEAESIMAASDVNFTINNNSGETYNGTFSGKENNLWEDETEE